LPLLSFVTCASSSGSTFKLLLSSQDGKSVINAVKNGGRPPTTESKAQASLRKQVRKKRQREEPARGGTKRRLVPDE
jgi:hypothetical protein